MSNRFPASEKAQTYDPAASGRILAKLRPPRQRIAAATRSQLLADLDSSLAATITLTLSPAGFGKTTALAQWFERLRTRNDLAVAWLTLDEDDGEETRFLANLALALLAAGLELDPVATLQAVSVSEAASRRSVLLAAIERFPKTIVVILDDYHRARSDDVDRAVEHLMRNAGSALHLVVSARDRPNLKVADLMAQGLVVDIGASALALTIEEARDIFGDALTADELTALHKRTEGWAVALQLAKLWLDRDSSRVSELNAFTGRTDEVGRYLLEQVLSDLDPNLQAFLAQTSILESFDAALADAVRQADDSGRMLARLTHLDALIVPLDNERRWFRYHHLFADFLGERLHRGEVSACELHQRAARYFADLGDTHQGVKHAHRSGDFEGAVELVRKAGGWEIVLHQGVGFTRGILAIFNPGQIAASALLLRIQGYLHMKLGDVREARRCIDRLAAMPSDDLDKRDAAIVEALLRTYADDVQDPNWVPELTERIAALDPMDHLGRATLRAAVAVGSLAAGDFAAAECESLAGIAAMETAGSTLGATYMRFHLAQSFMYRGRVQEAEQCLRAALVAAEENYSSDRALKAVGNSLLGHLLYWRDQRDEARTRIWSALDAIDAHDSWFDILSVAYRAALGLALAGDTGPSAAEILDRAEEVARNRQLPELGELVQAWRLEAFVAAGDLSRAQQHLQDHHLAERLRSADTPFDWRLRTALGLAIAQLHLRLDRSAEALRLLRPLRGECDTQQRLLDSARIDTVVAVALRERRDASGSREAIRRALAYSCAEDVPRVLTGIAMDVEPVLGAALRVGGGQALPETLRSHGRRIRQSLRATLPDGEGRLSARELAVLGQLCLGRSNKAIGRHLDLSENTVKFHLKHVFEKLGAASRSGAVTAAVRRGIIRID